MDQYSAFKIKGTFEDPENSEGVTVTTVGFSF